MVHKKNNWVILLFCPLSVIFPLSLCFSYLTVTDNISNIARSTEKHINSVIDELEQDNHRALVHPDNCSMIKQDVLYGGYLREMIVIHLDDVICSSKGKVDKQDKLKFALKNAPSNLKLFFIDTQDGRTLVVKNSSKKTFQYEAFSIVNPSYISDKIDYFNNDKVDNIVLKVGNYTYPEKGEFSHGIFSQVIESSKYGYSLMVNSSDDFIYRRAVFFGLSSIPISLLFSFLAYVVIYFSNQRKSFSDDLRKGISNEELFVVFQPIVHSDDHKIKGVEALVRWSHPELGVVYPNVFIPLAEKENLINQITDCVIEYSFKEFKLKYIKNSYDKNFHLSINIPPSYLMVKDNIEALSRYSRDFSNLGVVLTVEITERQMLDEKGRNAISELSRFGVLISIDDFGTGYTALSVIQEIEFDFLKIDKCFVDTIGIDTVNSTVLDSIIELGKKLNVSIIAEGVENEKQAKYLQEHGVEYLQGYLFSKPQKFSDLL